MVDVSVHGFTALTEAFFEDYLRTYPSVATQLGIHRHDHLLEDLSRPAMDARDRAVSQWLERLDTVDCAGLRPDQLDELQLMKAQAHGEVLHRNEFREWQQDPTKYITVVGDAVHSLISRNFAPLEQRMQAAIDRMRLAPALLDQARANLERPAGIATETALEQLGDTLEMFEQDVPQAFAAVADPSLKGQFEDANAAALAALRAFGGFLKDEVLPRSDGDFTVGERGLAGLLRYEDLVDEPLSELITLGQEELRRTQEEIAEIASRIDPNRSLHHIMDGLSRDHPSAASLVPEAAGLLEELRSFILERDLVTLPTDVRITVAETPSFMRYFGFAFCDSPGAFEETATEAYFYLTRPDPTWPAEQIESYLRFFNRSFLPLIAGHETYPGHYVHVPWQRRSSGIMPRAFWSTATAEGWAHYCEQMLLDEGYRAGDLNLRLSQLQAALLRLCRYLVALQLHTGALTYEESVEFFVREGRTERVVAEREVRRGALMPTFYAYTLGKLEILRLREACRAQQGAAFRLKDFHNQIVQTSLPLPLIRQRLLGGNAGRMYAAAGALESERLGAS